jgi:hypothetical protein
MDSGEMQRAHGVLTQYYRKLVTDAADAVLDSRELLEEGSFLAEELCDRHAMMIQRVGMLLNCMQDCATPPGGGKVKVETFRCAQEEISGRIEKLLQSQRGPTKIAHTSVEKITDDDFMVIVVLRNGQEERN